MANGKERPILFSAPMVRAILDGKKTQTRRLLTPQPMLAIMDRSLADALSAAQDAGLVPADEKPRWQWRGTFMMPWPHALRHSCPYGLPGDRMWVRETFHLCGRAQGGVSYRADDERKSNCPDGGAYHPWRPSIFMRRFASRITLEIKSVRVERLQDISEADAKAEGVDWSSPLVLPGERWEPPDEDPREVGYSIGSFAIQNFRKLWDSINHDRAPWASNPWVFAISFRRLP